ncbi:hypothetical protein [uncultured Tateyamaria sp.]|uniref:hypothetical protein n=1 Tax=uncultured Tateyamaria sp. TaxID=455651 RepID=UPI00261EB13D|nr:hypothetical protein [uncultured Tateyamaria sp.]
MKYEPIPGQPQYATEEETMSVIRAVLIEDAAPAPTRKEARAERRAAQARGAEADAETPVKEDIQGFKAFVERTLEGNPRRRADDLPVLQDPAPVAAKPVRKRRTNHVAGLVARVVRPVRDFRPTTRHLALASLALLVVLRPHWFVISGVLMAALAIAGFLLIGSDRIWRGVMAYLTRVEGRDPERAAQFRARLDRFACRWDGFLDMFPDGMVDSLYMPDFQDIQNGDAAHMDAMSERLARMVHDT